MAAPNPTTPGGISFGNVCRGIGQAMRSFGRWVGRGISRIFFCFGTSKKAQDVGNQRFGGSEEERKNLLAAPNADLASRDVTPIAVPPTGGRSAAVGGRPTVTATPAAPAATPAAAPAAAAATPVAAGAAAAAPAVPPGVVTTPMPALPSPAAAAAAASPSPIPAPAPAPRPVVATATTTAAASAAALSPPPSAPAVPPPTLTSQAEIKGNAAVVEAERKATVAAPEIQMPIRDGVVANLQFFKTSPDQRSVPPLQHTRTLFDTYAHEILNLLIDKKAAGQTDLIIDLPITVTGVEPSPFVTECAVALYDALRFFNTQPVPSFTLRLHSSSDSNLQRFSTIMNELVNHDKAMLDLENEGFSHSFSDSGSLKFNLGNRAAVPAAAAAAATASPSATAPPPLPTTPPLPAPSPTPSPSAAAVAAVPPPKPSAAATAAAAHAAATAAAAQAAETAAAAQAETKLTAATAAAAAPKPAAVPEPRVKVHVGEASSQPVYLFTQERGALPHKPTPGKIAIPVNLDVESYAAGTGNKNEFIIEAYVDGITRAIEEAQRKGVTPLRIAVPLLGQDHGLNYSDTAEVFAKALNRLSAEHKNIPIDVFCKTDEENPFIAEYQLLLSTEGAGK